MSGGKGLTVIHIGLGPIGQAIAKLVAATEGLQIAGAADPAHSLAGQDLGTALGLPKKLKIKIDGEPDRFAKKAKADVAFLCTTSSLKEMKPQLIALVERGINVISTCEELAFPAPGSESAFRDIAKAAVKKKVTVLGTGVNPGFAMDTLALALTAPCSAVERVSVTRVVDAGKRRLPLQRKIGAGLNLHQFRRAMTEKTVRHVGLVESLHMVANTLGWKMDKVEETLEPAIAPRDLETDYLRVPAGAASGIRQSVRGWRNGQLAVSLDLQMYVGAESPRDHVLIEGTPRIDMTITGGIAGDEATAAIAVNAIPQVLAAAPGVVSMRDLPVVHHLNPAQLKSRR